MHKEAKKTMDYMNRYSESKYKECCSMRVETSEERSR